MAMNRSYDPPISSPPSEPPRTISQVDTNSPTSEWGAIPRVMAKVNVEGIPLQRGIFGKSNTA